MAKEREIEGFMCLTDLAFELGYAMGGNVVYPSEADLRENKKCVDQCGIAKVKVSLVEVVKESSF